MADRRFHVKAGSAASGTRGLSGGGGRLQRSLGTGWGTRPIGIARESLRRARVLATRPIASVVVRPGRVPPRLLGVPLDIRVADATVAADIYAGYFALADRAVNLNGRSPFDVASPSEGWAMALHGFGWLRHLRAADTALARANARAFVDDWIANGGRHAAAAYDSGVTARRVLSWLSEATLLLDGEETPFFRRLMRSLTHQTTMLRRRLASGLDGVDRLRVAIAVAHFGLCVDRAVPSRRHSGPLLKELDRQILPDGGHLSRDPHLLVELLLDLIPLRQAYAARGAETPPALLRAIDRMMPIVRLFRHADDSLGCFNGTGTTRFEALETVLANDDVSAAPLQRAPYSGYQRLEGEDAVLLMDTGTPPPGPFAENAHAGTLSFEFSTEGSVLVVNCGHPDGRDGPMARAARATAAHSTMTLDDTSSARLPPLGGRGWWSTTALTGGPSAVDLLRGTDDAGEWVEASHDGYAASGWLHGRRLELARDGHRLDGLDTLRPALGRSPRPALPFAIRFHLHPAAAPSYHLDGSGIVVTLPSGRQWQFAAESVNAAPVFATVEESIVFAGPDGPRRTTQIVLAGEVAADTAIRWLFTRLG